MGKTWRARLVEFEQAKLAECSHPANRPLLVLLLGMLHNDAGFALQLSILKGRVVGEQDQANARPIFVGVGFAPFAHLVVEPALVDLFFELAQWLFRESLAAQMLEQSMRSAIDVASLSGSDLALDYAALA